MEYTVKLTPLVASTEPLAQMLSELSAIDCNVRVQLLCKLVTQSFMERFHPPSRHLLMSPNHSFEDWTKDMPNQLAAQYQPLAHVTCYLCVCVPRVQPLECSTALISMKVLETTGD
ncbi:hypothetical protein DYB38_009594 [Aphanomyces astaci]|uniref:Uncharacterized protein n=1 Tax=Aphanomyces astaci TaxID=112090 RepID=A0A397CPE7_APHAT|nr:hypothetical protein DYB38_009594 [Aphanomyces astaci]